MSQDSKILYNLKDSSLMKDFKLKKKRYQSNLFDFVNSKILANKSNQHQ